MQNLGRLISVFVLCVVAALLAVPPASAAPRPPDAAVRYVRAEASGNGSGRSWKHAASWRDLDRMIAEVGPGGEVLVAADDPLPGTPEVVLRHGGAPGAPVTIRGVSRSTGAPAVASVYGDRAQPVPGLAVMAGRPYAVVDPGQSGSVALSLGAGADHLRIAHLGAVDVGVAIEVAESVTDLEIVDLTARNVSRVLNVLGSGRVTGLTVSRWTVNGFSQGVVRLRGGSSAVRIVDVVADSEGQQAEPGSSTIGIAVHGDPNTPPNHDITVVNVQVRNLFDRSDGYLQGDGFTTEELDYDVTFVDCLVDGATDAGFDLKSASTTVERPVVLSAKRSFRVHPNQTGVVEAFPIVINAPRSHDLWAPLGRVRPSHVQGRGVALLTDIDFSQWTTSPIFDADGLARFTVQGGTVMAPQATVMASEEPGAVVTIADVTRLDR